jgi:hypothetical protein
MKQEFKETLISILRKTISDFQEVKDEIDQEPFSEEQYKNQEEYESFLDKIGLENLLLEMKAVLEKLSK